MVFSPTFTIGLVVLGLALGTGEAAAQNVTPDRSLPTQVSPDPGLERFTIQGGAARGNNLFHSFAAFSPETWSVVFDLNQPELTRIERIFGRVTGGELSRIDGLLQISGAIARISSCSIPRAFSLVPMPGWICRGLCLPQPLSPLDLVMAWCLARRARTQLKPGQQPLHRCCRCPCPWAYS